MDDKEKPNIQFMCVFRNEPSVDMPLGMITESICKKSAKIRADHYHSISLTLFVCKLCICISNNVYQASGSRLSQWSDLHNDLLSKRQGEFINGRSAVTHLSTVISWYMQWRNKKCGQFNLLRFLISVQYHSPNERLSEVKLWYFWQS